MGSLLPLIEALAYLMFVLSPIAMILGLVHILIFPERQ